MPTSTGAAIAITEVLPEFKDRFGGTALRVPFPVGSIADVVFVTERSTSTEEVNTIFEEEAATNRYHDILGATRDAIVSADILQDPRASIVSLESTEVVGGDLVKVLTWYDNEWGYAAQIQMVREAVRMAAN